MASTASITIGASTSGYVLVQSVSRQTLQLFVGESSFHVIYVFVVILGFYEVKDDQLGGLWGLYERL